MKSTVKYVIFRHNGAFAVTSVSNYYAPIVNQKKISSGFRSPQEIIDSYGDWFGTAPWNFAIHNI